MPDSGQIVRDALATLATLDHEQPRLVAQWVAQVGHHIDAAR